jgi:hypothetical protein
MMPFSSLSDDYSDDCWTLSSDAFRLHTEAIVWSNRKLLDCVIPKDELRRFAKHPEAASELVAHGYWTETADAYVIVHQARYQRTKEAVLRQQAANRENGAKGGRPPKAPREQFKPSTETHSLTHSLSDSKTERDRKGKTWPRRGSSSEEQIDKVTGEVFASVCDHPLEIAPEWQRDMCNSCWTATAAASSWNTSS